jgi:uncharacterized protein YyaL (SSP411 family)
MIKSLLRYTRFLSQIVFKGNTAYITSDLFRYFHGEDTFHAIPAASASDREQELKQVIDWLLQAQDKMGDGGMGSFHLASGWGSSYPETTGYIIPTLLKYSDDFKDDRSKTAALQAAQFLLGIQKPSGGWQGGRIGENRPEIVFNTGQIIRGMVAAYNYTQDNLYLDAAVRGADWLCDIQHEQGYWKKHALMNEARVYDAYLDPPLLNLHRLTGTERYREAALKNLRWILDRKMHQNGWFEDCDNTVKRNDRPILHTIAYTLDGLIESGELLEDAAIIKAASAGADQLKNQILGKGRLYGRYDRNWNGSEYFLCTGAAQMAIVWIRLYRLAGDSTYLRAADRALDILVHIQRRSFIQKPDTIGAIPGSFPIWGRYEPFAFPNWAAKFFADALLMRAQIKD